MTKPLCIDLCCGSGGWTAGFLAEGYEVIGFDVARHPEYPGRLVIQDVRTLAVPPRARRNINQTKLKSQRKEAVLGVRGA